jgi:hypothetical protein
MQNPPRNLSIFVSYRREDTGEAARELADALQKIKTAYYEYTPFIDVQGITGGSDWRKAIEQRLESTDALIALIGKDWLSVRDQYGRRRIDDPEDVVRYELGVALERGIVVLPCLGPSVSMPPKQALPSDVAGITDRQAIQFGGDWQVTASSIATALFVHQVTAGLKRT